MHKISHRQGSSNWKSHIQCKQQSTREDIEKDISSSIGEKNISVEDDSCMDIDNDIETNLNSAVECEEINDVDEECSNIWTIPSKVPRGTNKDTYKGIRVQ
jgi:hypothetical protein